MYKTLLTIIACIHFMLLTGCATVNVVEDADGEPVNALTMTCNTPYEFTQDCRFLFGLATRRIVIDDLKIAIAGSENGRTVLVMDATLFGSALNLRDFIFINNPTHSITTNNSYILVKEVLNEYGIGINRVRPIKSLAHIDGYILELESDGYTLLKEYSVR